MIFSYILKAKAKNGFVFNKLIINFIVIHNNYNKKITLYLHTGYCNKNFYG